MENEIKLVDRDFLNQLFDSEDYEPRGRFICANELNGVVIYTTVFNDTGEADTEEFYTVTAAICWLNGNPAYNIYGERVKIEIGDEKHELN